MDARTSKFLTAFRNQIRLALESGGNPTLTALVELTGSPYHHFSQLLEKMSDNELRGLDYDLKKLGIESKAIKGLLDGPRPANKSPKLDSTAFRESDLADSLSTVVKALATLSEADRRRLLDTVEVFFYGPQVRPWAPSVVNNSESLDDFQSAAAG